jgi:uncharacterized protein
MLTIDITSFQSGVHRVEMAPSAEEVNLDPQAFGDITVQARLHCRRDRILVRLEAEATATLTCDRTLRPYEQPLEGDYSLLFGPPSMTGEVPDDADYEEVRPFDPSQREIDVTDAVRDTLLLSIPQRKIAPGAEEEDIDTTFGAPDDEEAEEEAIDPRWEKLKELRDDD